MSRHPHGSPRLAAARPPAGGREGAPAPDTPGKALPPEVLDLLTRAAALPRGLAFLHAAPLETVAITLRADALLVLRVREAIDDPRLHAPVIAAFKRAVARWKGEDHPEGFHPLPPAPPCPGPADLLSAAEHHPLGLDFLAAGPLETVAVTFGTTPFVVLEARPLLRGRGAGTER
ncbi:MAG: hypothetical protein L6R43_17085 [Planctomycetes bacterium]|nr:hypothetical protein [Planctomycetota bacterium]